MTAPEASNITALISILARENGGFIPFERFMEMALYHPDYGYYSKNVGAIGGRGADFTTSPALHPDFAVALKCWIESAGKKLKLPGPWHVIEVGAGTGILAHNLLRAFGLLGRRRIRLHIVETSEPLREIQQKRLKLLGVKWHRSMEDALEAAKGRALVFSNEVVDAFPCVRLQYEPDRDGWMEMGLRRHEDSSLSEDLRKAPWARIVTAEPSILQIMEEPRDGQRVEIHLAYRDWLRSWLPHLKHGAILTIDYGDAVENLYHRRLQGSVRGYFKHQRVDGMELYMRLGRQDLTADVNFTDLMHWSAPFGLKNRLFITQREFLQRALPDLETRCTDDAALQMIVHPEGAGAQFKVLDQRKIPRDGG